jgi:two-component system cell cycle response regulator
MFDPLTGLYNRRFAERRLAAEISRSERKGHPLTIVLIDLNDFKQINDSYGHAVGDLVLREFAQRLSRSIRGEDVRTSMPGCKWV